MRGKSRQTIRMLLLSSLLATTQLFAQGTDIQWGVQLFWQAEFEQAIHVLERTIASDTLKTDEMFTGYLYLGFCHARSNHNDAVVDSLFKKAITVNPLLRLNAFKIPPDLLKRFNRIRENMIGAIWVETAPVATAAIYDSLKILQMTGTTPMHVKNLLLGTYQLHIEKAGYLSHNVPVRLHAGTTDTVRLRLIPIRQPAQRRKWWLWTSGGVVVATVTAFLLRRESPKSPPESTDLPMPPERPH